MNAQKHIFALVMMIMTSAFATGGVAQAAFPNYSDCPRTSPGVRACLDIQSIRGSLEIKGFTVPLGDSLEIRGGLVPPAEAEGTISRFVAPAGTNGFFSKPIQIPGGILGIELPIPGNAVTGTAQLAGSASSIIFNLGLPVTTVSVPVKLKLDNPILGPNCYIGTNSTPVRLNLTTGTTSPPLPNRPISGSLGRLVGGEDLELLGASNVDNSFAVPGASGCGLGLGLISAVVNLKLRLPSASGNNTMIVENNIGLRGF